MKSIRVLTVTFDTELANYEIPAFRGAIIAKVGRENILFNNHLSDDTFLYKYPLIQYKLIGKKPAIQCIDLAVDEIHKFFTKSSWDIRFSDRDIEMKILRLDMNQFKMQVWDKSFTYDIRSWIALNQENHKKYQAIESLSDKIVFLEKILTGNILSFAKGIEWTIDKPISLKIKELKEPRPVKLKSQTIMGFNITFTTNVFLPNYIGLGKGTSLGFGMVHHQSNYKKHINSETAE